MRYTILISIVNIIAYIAMVQLSHLFAPGEYGEIVYTTNLVSMLVFFCLIGRTEHELREAVLNRVRVNAAPLLLSGVAFVALIMCIAAFYPPVSGGFVYVALPLGLSMIVSEYLSVYFRVDGRFRALAFAGKPTSLLYILLAVYILLSGARDRALLLMAGTGLLAYGAAFVWFAWRRRAFAFQMRAIFDPRSIPFWLSSILFLANLQAGTLILGHLGELKAVAEYSLALMIVTVSTMIYSAYFSVYHQGTFYSKWTAGRKDALGFVLGAIRNAALLSVLIACCAFLTIRFGYQFVFDLRKYDHLLALSILMLPIVVIRAFSTALGISINLEDTIWRKNAISLGAYAAGLLVSLLFARAFGIYGIYSGFLTGESLLMFGFAWTFVGRLSKERMTGYEVFSCLYAGWPLRLLRWWRVQRARGRMHKKVVVCGYYGFQNLGDDLFICAVDEPLQKLAQGQVTVTYLGTPLEGVPRECFPLAARALPALYRADNAAGRFFRSLLKFYYSAAADFVLFAGGSLFSEPSNSRIALDRMLVAAGVRFIGLGISIGPFKDAAGQRQVIDYCRIFELMHVRDQRSLSLLQDAGLRAELTSDIVFSLSLGADVTQGARESTRVLFVPVPLTGAWADVQARLLDDARAVAQRRGWKFEVCSFQPGGGRPDPIARQYSGDIADFLRWVEGFDYVVTARLHGAIIAAILGIPFYLLQHHTKCTDCLSELGWPGENRRSPGSFVDFLKSAESFGHGVEVRNEKGRAADAIRDVIMYMLETRPHAAIANGSELSAT
ncbi:hypothetical protein E4L96_15840 [Massilia arenosa]|uniref:Polysaccharide pyruvyl transferase domain-containing protein n=1 Tax=Zemynaea arenosa TaxID=2561931 RepID=A0A4Y9S5K0_9BURK|nr:polysaccharide pyruvyl transferase family protein [Massilia arenosa]TFW16756.1 hypothetical protein E4L96_15840 [Massilia arenosa]